MFDDEGDDDMVRCPYDPAHRFLRKRLQAHLIKCRKNNPDIELQKCPFNVTHLIAEADFVQHKLTCPDRKLVSHYKYQQDSKELEPLKHDAFEKDDDWDIEV